MRRAWLLVVLLLALACRRETVRPEPQPAPAPRNESSDRGHLVRRLESDVRTLNYVLHGTDDEHQVLAYLYDPLVAVNENLEPVPATAARWQISEDRRTYTLYLDPRATFSDGKPVRAADVIFTINRILDEASPQFSSGFENLDREKTTAVGDRTVRVVFKEPRAGQLFAFQVGVMPEHVYSIGDFGRNSKVIGNGPYVLEKWQRGRSIVLRRRDDYWRERPPIRTITFRPVADDAVAWKAMQRGDLDVTRVDNDLWWRVREDPAVAKTIAFHDVFEPGYNCIAWNLGDPLFDDARVRRALAMAFDRQAVIEGLYHGQARPVTGPFTVEQWAHNPEILPVDFNPQGARALLASAGWTDADGDEVLERDGQPFEFSLLIIAGNEASSEQAQVFQESLAAIGVRMNVTPLDDAAFFDQVLARNYQAASLAWVNDLDPDPYSLFHSSQLPPEGFNIVGYSSPAADQLIDEARAETDLARRADLYHQLHELLARDQPYLWTVQASSKWAVNRRVQNVRTAEGLGLFLWYPGPRAWWVE